MSYELKNNTGSLFKNDRKEKDSHPDYTGDVLVEGKRLRIAAWIKQGKNGKYMSLSFSPHREAVKGRDEPAPRDLDSEIPF